MKDLFKAIFARFNDAPGGAHNPLYTLVNGRLYNTAAPNTSSFPLVVMSLVTNDVDQLMERCTVQFSVFSAKDSDTEVLAIYDALIALYDNCDLPNLGTPGNLGMERSHCVLYREDPVWHYVVEYEVWVARK